MKRSIVALLVALCITAALGSPALALSGQVMAGASFVGDNYDNHHHLFVGAEAELADRLFAGAAVIVNEPESFEIWARYGVGTGLFGEIYFYEGTVWDWHLGGFVERELSDRLALRAFLGVEGFTLWDKLYFGPVAFVQLRYDLSGPYAVYAEIDYYKATAALGYEF